MRVVPRGVWVTNTALRVTVGIRGQHTVLPCSTFSLHSWYWYTHARRAHILRNLLTVIIRLPGEIVVPIVAPLVAPAIVPCKRPLTSGWWLGCWSMPVLPVHTCASGIETLIRCLIFINNADRSIDRSQSLVNDLLWCSLSRPGLLPIWKTSSEQTGNTLVPYQTTWLFHLIDWDVTTHDTFAASIFELAQQHEQRPRKPI